MPMGMGPQAGAGAIQERSSVLVIVLSIVTCNIYFIYWIWKTSQELRDATGDTTINPMIDLVIGIVTWGMWGIYVMWRNSQKAHQLLVARDPNHKDQSQTVLIMGVLTVIVGITMVVAMYLTQEDLNALARAR